MANFEGLIRQALQNQNAGDPAVRQRIYQSSRNALAKMLQNAPDVGEDAAQRQRDRLEASIASIEADYVPPEEAVSLERAPLQDDVVLPEPELPDPELPEPEPAGAGTLEQTPQQVSPPQSPAAGPSGETEETDPVLAMLEQASLGTVDAPGAGRTASEPVAPDTTPPAEELAVGDAPHDDHAARYLDESSGLQDYRPEPLFPLPQSEPTVEVDPQITTEQPGQPVAPEPAAPQAPVPQPVQSDLGDAPELNQGVEPASAENPPQSDLDSLTAEREPYPVYNRKNPILRRIWPIALILGILLVILWLMYALFTNMGENGASDGQSDNPGPVGETQLSDDGSATITLLEPTDLSALVTAGRGTAELTTVQNEQMLRLQSVRQNGQTGDSAQPILLEMERGVLQQIMGKPVTVELYAKSGLTGPAQFAIECSVAGESVCGRKRFRVGQQPERIVFSMDLKDISDAGARAFLAMNTDITTEADTSGKGDIIDLIYARLRFEP